MKYGVIKTIWDNPIMQRVVKLADNPTEDTPSKILDIGDEVIMDSLRGMNATGKDDDRAYKLYRAIGRMAFDVRRTLEEQAMREYQQAIRELDSVNDKDFNSKIH